MFEQNARKIGKILTTIWPEKKMFINRYIRIYMSECVERTLLISNNSTVTPCDQSLFAVKPISRTQRTTVLLNVILQVHPNEQQKKHPTTNAVIVVYYTDVYKLSNIHPGMRTTCLMANRRTYL